MGTVTASQRWGLGDPLPAGVHVEQKNGWGPMSTGYRLNSFGHVSGNGRSYQLAILSRSPNGFTYGKTTVNRVWRIVFDALDVPLRLNPVWRSPCYSTSTQPRVRCTAFCQPAYPSRRWSSFHCGSQRSSSAQFARSSSVPDQNPVASPAA